MLSYVVDELPVSQARRQRPTTTARNDSYVDQDELGECRIDDGALGSVGCDKQTYVKRTSLACLVWRRSAILVPLHFSFFLLSLPLPSLDDPHERASKLTCLSCLLRPQVMTMTVTAEGAQCPKKLPFRGHVLCPAPITRRNLSSRLADSSPPISAMDRAAHLRRTVDQSAYDKGDVSFVLISGFLVLLMIPGLAFLYSGLVRRKNALHLMFVCILANAIVILTW